MGLQILMADPVFNEKLASQIEEVLGWVISVINVRTTDFIKNSGYQEENGDNDVTLRMAFGVDVFVEAARKAVKAARWLVRWLGKKIKTPSVFARNKKKDADGLSDNPGVNKRVWEYRKVLNFNAQVRTYRGFVERLNKKQLFHLEKDFFKDFISAVREYCEGRQWTHYQRSQHAHSC